MLRRVLKRKESDRVLWIALAVLTVGGVVVAVQITHEAEKKRAGWVGGDPLSAEFQENPLAAPHPDSASSAAVPVVASDTAPPVAAAVAGPAPRVVELLTTPASVTVPAMTPACRGLIDARGPWADANTQRPWPQCVDRAGNAMVVQFCTYARLASGEWVPSANTRSAPRCQAELPLVRQGKVRGVKTP